MKWNPWHRAPLSKSGQNHALVKQFTKLHKIRKNHEQTDEQVNINYLKAQKLKLKNELRKIITKIGKTEEPRNFDF